MKKKILALIMASLMGITLVSCGEEKKEPAGDNKPAAEDNVETEKPMLTNEESNKIIADICENLKKDFKDNKDIQIDMVERFNNNCVYIESKDINNKYFPYKDIKKNGLVDITIGAKPDNSNCVKLSGFYFINLKDFKEKKVKIQLEKSIIPDIYKYMDKNPVDLSKFNDEINKDVQYNLDIEVGDNDYAPVFEINDLVLSLNIRPFGDEISIGYEVWKKYKDQ